MGMPSKPLAARAKLHRVLGSTILLSATVVLAPGQASNLEVGEPALELKAAATAYPGFAVAPGTRSRSTQPDARISNQIGTVVQPGATGVSYTANFDRGWFDIELSGLPALPSAKFLSYVPAVVIQSGVLLSPAGTFTEPDS